MVLQRRLYYGFTGHQVPVVPRASRSARGKRPIGKKCEANQIRAFEILASVAGNLLQDGESSTPANATANTAKHDQEDREKFLKVDPADVETCCENSFSCTPKLQAHYRSYSLNEFLHPQDHFSCKGSVTTEHFDYSGKIYAGDNLAAVDSKNGHRSPSGKVGANFSHAQRLLGIGLECVIEEKSEDDLLNISSSESRTLPVKSCSVDEMELDMNHPASTSSQSNLETTLYTDCIAVVPFSGRCPEIKKFERDDDEKSVRCPQRGTTVKTYRPLSHIGDRRTRKLSASSYFRAAPNLKGGSSFRTDGKTKPYYYSGRTCYNNQRSQKIFPFKKRKFFDQSPFSMSNRAFHCEQVFNSPEKTTNASGVSTVAGQYASSDSRDCNVKLSIKSFKVPELFVEIPATATIASLKRTVLEAVTSILGDGLHVGILLQGKKVRDDSKTLRQIGISQDDKHHSLGFMLEPRRAQIQPPSCADDCSFRSGSALRELSRHTSLMLQPGTSGVSPVSQEINLGGCVESDFGVVPPPADISADNTMSDSKALVTVPTINVKALAVVPFHCKSGHAEFGQRRIRRPFSVSEVEALVLAVEKLGTGRWRDVKMRAFDNANHRTYVDLKDKWKTLVHTARISPQQRRGEPVPQELLDRVLAAHAYWSQHQVKQLVKASI